eukprot:TRINITY_DN3890_c0_g1_i1.p1 TRINITY_DN3890_c0_g1~~TRINITY_DN3890_c0_g1_i1.p1  ORF type:complete len:1362 (-),score=299.82 TRINITY_DN3890_c0_g1_i1:274-4359(-)
MEFVIPICAEDLFPESQKKSFRERYYVESEWKVAIDDEANVSAAVDGVDDRLRSDGVEAIFRHENFDVLFYLFHQVESSSITTRNKLTDFMSATLQRVVEALQNIFAEASIEKDLQYEMRNSLKMYIYLNQLLIHAMERIETSDLAQGVASAQGSDTSFVNTNAQESKAKSKKGRKQAETLSAWNTVREEVLTELLRIVDAKFERLWPMGKVEDDFLRQFALISYAIMENAQAFRALETKARCTRILALLAIKYHQTPLVTEGLIRLLSNKEHVASSVGTIIQSFAQESGHYFVGELIREIGRLEFSELAKDATLAKCISLAIVDMADVAPHLLHPHFGLILPHLNGEAYSIRSSIIQAAGQILVRVLANDTSERALSLKHSLLEIITDRILDQNAFTRSRALQTCILLCEERGFPVQHFPGLARAVTGRLHDKASIVRKSALQALVSCLQYNPYSDNLSRSAIQSQLQELHTQRKELSSLAVPQDAIKLENDHNIENAEEYHPNDEDKDQSIHTKTENPKLAEVEASIKMLQAALNFSELVQESFAVAVQLLASKNTSDILEAVHLFSTAYSLKFDGAQDGVRKMIFLVWSRESSVKEALFEAYKTLYLTAPSSAIQNGGEKGEAVFITVSLINLVQDMTLAETTAFEDLIQLMIEKDMIPASVLKTLVDVFLAKYEGVSTQQSKMSLKLLSYMTSNNSASKYFSVENLYQAAFKDRAKSDPEIGQFCCKVLLKLCNPSLEIPTFSRIPVQHEIFSHLFTSLVEMQPNPMSGYWFPFAEAAIDFVYLGCDIPEAFTTELLKRLASAAFRHDGTPKTSFDVARLLVAAGHVALKQMTYIEQKHTQLRKKRASKSQSAESNIEDELGVGNAATDESEHDLFAQITERSIVQENLISTYILLLDSLLKNILLLKDSILKNAVVLAMCKFMTVSSAFCENHLQLFFTLMKNAPESVMRRNLIVAVADLVMRFPNLLEPWSSHIYSRLDDENASVKKHALMVLTHLILNDMIKIKGQIGQLAKLLEDEDQNISDLARLFFHEYSQKGNALYNIIPDAISSLTADTNLSLEKFQCIMKLLFSYIDKEKHTESLVEKLCHRYKSSKDVALWRQLTFCIGLLNLGEKGFKKLADLFRCYQEAVMDDEVYHGIQHVISKARKFVRPEMKTVIDDLEAKVGEVRRKLDEEREVLERIGQVGKQVESEDCPSDSGAHPDQATDELTSHKDQQASEEQSCTVKKEDEASVGSYEHVVKDARSSKSSESKKGIAQTQKSQTVVGDVGPRTLPGTKSSGRLTSKPPRAKMIKKQTSSSPAGSDDDSDFTVSQGKENARNMQAKQSSGARVPRKAALRMLHRSNADDAQDDVIDD